MLKRIGKAAALLLTGCMLLLCAPGTAESMHREVDNPSFEMQVTVGYDGLMTYGKTMPVRVVIRNNGSDFEGTLGLNAYVNAREYDRYETPVTLPAGAEREYILTPSVFARQKEFTVQLTENGETVCAVNAEAKTVADPSALLIGVLSTRPQNMNNLNISRENDTLARYEQWQTVPLTAETFPEDLALMKSLGMLVIDDIDPASLSKKQQECLDLWLRSGRIILCGGGANAGRNIPYFSGYTGLSLEKLSISDDVASGLGQMTSRKENGHTKIPVTLAEYNGGEALARDSGGRGLIWRSQVNAGRIYTAAFETGDPRLNAESLMHWFWQQALVDNDQTIYSSVLYLNANDMPPAIVNSGYSAPVPARSLLLPGLLIVAGTLALACALWWILKRKDLHRWMWAAIPLLSAAAAAALILLAGSSQANRPMAVIISNLVQDSTGGIRDYSSISAAPDLPGRHEYSMEGETLKMQAYEFNYYMEDEDEPEEPDRLRTCYTGGAECAAVVESHGLREQATLVSESVSRIRGQIDGAVWMEEDGLHGEIVNGTDQTFAPGWVITTYGYTRTAALAPGEKAEVLLTKRTVADPQDPKYEEGGLYLNGELSLYGIASGAMGYDYTRYANGDGREAVLTTMLTNAADQLNRDKGNQYGYAETTMFLYCAEPEYLPRPVFKADGKAVEQQTSLTLLTAELTYTAVGRTGVVFRSAGMDIPERVETDMLGRPTDMALPMKPAYYHVLSDIPTFRFDLKGMGDMQISMLRVTMDTYTAGNIKGYAFNIRTRQWDEITLNEDIKKPEQYLDPAGKLYVQFRANSGTQDTYLEMPSPSIMLEGRMPNAAD